MTLAAETFTQGTTAIGAPPTTFYDVDVGGYIKPSNQCSILFHIRKSHAIGYFALY